MKRRSARIVRSLPILAMAAASALLGAPELPSTNPAPAGAVATTQPATQPATPATQPTTAPANHTDIQLPAPASRPVKEIKLEFKDAPLSQVVDYLSESLGFTVKKTSPIEGRINLVSRTPVTPEVALTVLDEALADKGLTAVQEGTILKIVAVTDAKRLNLPVHVGENPEEIAATAEWITQIIPVKNIDAVKLRTDIQPLIGGDADFTANQGSNALIMTDTSANIKRIVTIVSELDKSTTQASQVKIYHLKFANATATAKLLTSVFAPDQAQNAQQGAFGGGGGGGGGRGRMMQMMMGAMGGPGGGAGGNSSDTGKITGKVTTAADDRTNTVIVVAPAEILKLVDKILEELDSDPTDAAVIKPFQLKFADPASAAKLINSIFQPPQQNNQGGGFPFPGFGQRIQNVSDNDRNVRVTAAAADKSNTLVVTAPPPTMKLIEDILNKLDSDPAAMSQVSVFQLKFADSDSAAKLINTIFTTSQTAQQPQVQSPFGFRGPQLQGVASTSSARNVNVNAVSDERTNTVVVTAPGDLMRVVSGILEKLDSNPSAESALFIYHLRNGVAADIQATMSSLFSMGTTGSNNNSNGNRTSGQSLTSSGVGSTNGFGGSSRGGGLGGSGGGIGGNSGSNFGQPLTSNSSSLANRPTGASGNAAASGASVRATSELVGQVIVVADNDTNSLLVSTASKYKEQVVKIIEELDRPVPQVLIKVLVAEVTHERTNDLGPDFSVLNTRPSGKGVTAQQNLGNVGSFSTNGGLVVSLLEDNLNATLHLLATEGKLDVLSRPYILASDNQAASITVGQEVPFITATQITDTGQQINTITYQAVGIILNVTPHINPDGKVTLDVSPEISAISATTVPIGNGINAPVIDNRSAQSRVTIANGNTIVIGGMMQDQKTTTINKIPLLGDIPFIGQAFSRYQDDRSKTELLIFLTPHVAAQPDALKGMAEDEVHKGTVLTPNAVEPGAFQRQMDGMHIGATPRESTTRESVIEVRPTPSTQPFRGINISGGDAPPAAPGK